MTFWEHSRLRKDSAPSVATRLPVVVRRMANSLVRRERPTDAVRLAAQEAERAAILGHEGEPAAVSSGANVFWGDYQKRAFSRPTRLPALERRVKSCFPNFISPSRRFLVREWKPSRALSIAELEKLGIRQAAAQGRQSRGHGRQPGDQPDRRDNPHHGRVSEGKRIRAVPDCRHGKPRRRHRRGTKGDTDEPGDDGGGRGRARADRRGDGRGGQDSAGIDRLYQSPCAAMSTA